MAGVDLLEGFAIMEVGKVKDGMLTICRRVSGLQTKQYVRDKAGKLFMTFDHKPRHGQTAFVEISAQRFKDNFARCSEMVRQGVQFKLSLKSGSTVYARRHFKYRDACDDMLQQWQTKISETAISNELERRVLAEVQRAIVSTTSDTDQVLNALKELKLGMARLAIGHKPDQEGMLPKNRDSMPDDDDTEDD